VDVAVLRELMEDVGRPGQPGGSLTVDRLPRPEALVPGGHAGANRYDWVGGGEVGYALYGRGRYGRTRYGHA